MGTAVRWVRHGQDAEFAPLGPDVGIVRVTRLLDDVAWERLAGLLAPRPDVELWIEEGDDLEALRHLPFLRRLTATSLRLRSLDGLRHVEDSLEVLSLADTLRPVSIRPVAGLTTLRRLYVNGTWKDIDTVSRLTNMERLGIRSIDVQHLVPLTSLRHFTCGVGTIRNLDLLPDVGRIELVELYMLRKTSDLSALGRIPSLRWLLLSSTSAVTMLPSFRDCPELRWVFLDEMHGITDLRPVADAPNLEVLLLGGMRQLQPEALRPLIGHPTLRAGSWGLGSLRRNAAARALLPDIRVDAPWEDPAWDGMVHPVRA